MKRIIITTVAALVVLLVGCKEEGRLDHVDANAPAPAPISNVSFENTAGGAVIKYDMPQDPNFLYVKAIYERRPGLISMATSSNFVDSVVVEGFGNTNPATVKLISVGRNEKESPTIIEVEITPKTPIVMSVRNDLIVKKAIGGVKILVKNPFVKDLSFRLLKRNDAFVGGWQELRTFYSRSEEIVLAQRGLEAVESDFAVCVSDTWGNVSDTLYTTLTPIYEQEILKPYGYIKHSGDVWDGGGGGNSIECLWDERFDFYASNLFVSNVGKGPLPRPFTIDLRRTVELSRIVAHQRGSNGDTYYCYDGTSVKRFELYGTIVENPNADINHSDWTKLGEFTGFRPSGRGAGSPSTIEDHQYACIDGESFEFTDENGDPKATVPVRFVKWRTLETWGGVGVGSEAEIIISELDFFGKVIGYDPEEPESPEN